MSSSETPGAWARAFEQAARMVGHQVELKTRKYGRVTHYWVVCDCGYESGHGRSFRFAMSSGLGHISRVSDALGPPARARRDNTPIVDIPQNVRGLT